MAELETSGPFSEICYHLVLGQLDSFRDPLPPFDKRKKETYLIEIAVPLCHNLEKTWETKMTKYLELSHEVKKM